jgi:hypothetical protein
MAAVKCHLKYTHILRQCRKLIPTISYQKRFAQPFQNKGRYDGVQSNIVMRTPKKEARQQKVGADGLLFTIFSL